MANDRLDESLRHFRRELQLAEEELRILYSRVEALRNVVTGFETLIKTRAPGQMHISVSDEDAVTGQDTGTLEAVPRGADAVRRVFSEIGRPITPKQLVDELRKRGWLSTVAKHPEASVRAAVTRLAEAGELEKVERGLYRLTPLPLLPDEERDESG